MRASETYSTTVELPGVGDVQLTVGLFRGHQGGGVIRQSIIKGTHADGEELTATDRARAHAQLPPLD